MEGAMLRKILWGGEGFTLTELLVNLMLTGVLVGSTAVIFQDFLVQTQALGDELERRTVETAIEAYIALDVLGGNGLLPAREIPAVIGSNDEDAPFAVYLQGLPTRCRYAWTLDGLVTQECPKANEVVPPLELSPEASERPIH